MDHVNIQKCTKTPNRTITNDKGTYQLVAFWLRVGIGIVHCLFVVSTVPLGIDIVMCFLIELCLHIFSDLRKCDVAPESATA